MNLFYEPLPTSVELCGQEYEIITDFREWIRFTDMVKSDISANLKAAFTLDMFKEGVSLSEVLDLKTIWDSFIDFLNMDRGAYEEGTSVEQGQKPLYSYVFDGPYILASFMKDYGIDLLETEYMHWWKFRMLFEGLSENTEIKQRIYYRSIDLNSIKDKEERKRIRKIQNSIRLPQEILSDGDIANAFV